MDRSCIILKDMNAQYHDMNWKVRLMKQQTSLFITEVGHLTKR